MPPYWGQTHGDGDGRSTIVGSPATTPKPAKRAHRSGDRVVSSPRIEDQNSLNTSPAPRTPPRFPHPQASFVMPPYRGQTHGESNTSIYSVLPDPQVSTSRAPHFFPNLSSFHPARRYLSSCSQNGDRPQARRTPAPISSSESAGQNIASTTPFPQTSPVSTLPAGISRHAAISVTDPRREGHQPPLSSPGSAGQNIASTSPFPRTSPHSTSPAGDSRRAAILGTDPRREQHQLLFGSAASEDQNRLPTATFPRPSPASPRPQASFVMQPSW